MLMAVMMVIKVDVNDYDDDGGSNDDNNYDDNDDKEAAFYD